MNFTLNYQIPEVFKVNMNVGQLFVLKSHLFMLLKLSLDVRKPSLQSLAQNRHTVCQLINSPKLPENYNLTCIAQKVKQYENNLSLHKKIPFPL